MPQSNAARSARPATTFGPQRSLGVLVALVTLLVCASASGARATPVISEILYDAVGSDDGFGFVELQGAPGTILDGLTLEFPGTTTFTICAPARIGIREMSSPPSGLHGWHPCLSFRSRRKTVGFGSAKRKREG